jgi:hypothetical protein
MVGKDAGGHRHSSLDGRVIAVSVTEGGHHRGGCGTSTGAGGKGKASCELHASPECTLQSKAQKRNMCVWSGFGAIRLTIYVMTYQAADCCIVSSRRWL